jgi:hypothetical protein
MSHGLKSTAQELHQYGRNGDTMVAHINPQEAALLKSLGGSGTINPRTGLPEFGLLGIGGGGGILGTGINKNASDPISNALSNNPISQGVSSAVQGAGNAIDQGLVSIDKTVGKAIPGGWGTVASVAGSVMGLPTPMLVGLGALNGSGVMRKGGSFNLQGAIMGGAMAYGMSELGEYVRGAADVPTVDAYGNASTPTLGATPTSSFDPKTLASTGMIESTDKAALNALSKSIENGAGAGLQVAPPPSIGSQIMSGNFGKALSQAGTNISEGFSNLGTNIAEGASKAWDSAGNALDKATTLDTYKEFGADRLKDAGNTGSGIKNLMGLGEGTAKEAAAQAAKTAAIEGTMKPMMATGLTLYGGMGLAALDEQRKYLQDQANAGAISNAEYNASLADIERQADIARKSVAANPLQSGSDISGVSRAKSLYDMGEDTLYGRNNASDRLYAAGGTVNPAQANPPDDQTNIGNQSPIQQIDQNPFSGGLQAMFAGLRGLGANQSPPQEQNVSHTFTPPWEPQFDSGQPQPFKGGFPSQLDSGIGAQFGGQLGGGGSQGAFPLQGQYGIVKMAAGGMPPRFLSGGGDGMSDSIHASIDGSQEARLADGEFVIPADVVSHIGNGSSKAGAKQLYSMMDRVRQARTGTKKQGKQINPSKFLAA